MTKSTETNVPPCGLITGCSKGLGLAIAAKQLKAGHKVIGISRSTTKEIEHLLSIYPDNFSFHEANLSAELVQSNEAFGQLLDSHCFDYGVLNSGVRSRVSLEEASADTYLRVFDANTLVQIMLAKGLAFRSIRLRRKLNILFVSSIVGNLGFSQLTSYAASKSSLDGFMRSFAVEMASQGIVANCLSPGFVKTSYYRDFISQKPELYRWTLSRTPLGRWASPMEIAKVVHFLISSSNTYMTGSTIQLDGGWSSS